MGNNTYAIHFMQTTCTSALDRLLLKAAPLFILFLIFIAVGRQIFQVPKAHAAEQTVSLYDRNNLMAWCIVPFDAKKRDSVARAEMLERLGFKYLAYDWREEHIPTFDAEVKAMKEKGITIAAWWFPASLDPTAEKILDVIQRHGLKTQLWITMGDPASQSKLDSDKVSAAANILRPIAERAQVLGCKIGLYNHGGWFGEPENQIAIIKKLGLPNVGIVYNFHHGHDHMERFASMFSAMQPYLLAVNLNGMVPEGEKKGMKIMAIGKGTDEFKMMKIIQDSNWKGLVGILDHRPETDSEPTLKENLAGVDQYLRSNKR